jgi:hypothetical protein
MSISIREENVKHPISWLKYRIARFHYMWIRPLDQRLRETVKIDAKG